MKDLKFVFKNELSLSVLDKDFFTLLLGNVIDLKKKKEVKNEIPTSESLQRWKPLYSDSTNYTTMEEKEDTKETKSNERKS